MFKMLILYFLAMFSFSIIAEDSIDLRLRARGLQALERIEKLVKKNGDSNGKKLSKQDVCDWAVEGMFLGFAHPELIKIVKKEVPQPLSKEAVSYALLIKEDSIGFQIWFTYLKKSDSMPSANEIALLKDGWSIVTGPKLHGYINVRSPECFYSINLNDPLDIKSSPL